MKTLHLIVHKELLEQYHFLGRVSNVLQRISEIEQTCKEDIQYIPWKNEINNYEHLEQQVVPIEGYDLVMLYGGGRKYCLNETANILQRKGICVAYDLHGTTD